MQKMLSYVRRAVDHYHMIDEGDRIAVGVSGGKDSLALLVALSHAEPLLSAHLPSWLLHWRWAMMRWTSPCTDAVRQAGRRVHPRPHQIGPIVFDIPP